MTVELSMKYSYNPFYYKLDCNKDNNLHKYGITFTLLRHWEIKFFMNIFSCFCEKVNT